MASRLSAGRLLDCSVPFSVISGAISGVTPKTSGFMKVKNAASVDLALSTTSTAAGSWSFQVATSANGRDSQPHPSPPTTPTGASQSATVTVLIPDAFSYLQVTFTPSGGSGTAVCQAGKIVSRPLFVGRERQLGLSWYVASSDTLAGTPGLQFSWNYDGSAIAGSPQLSPGLNNSDDPAIWLAATDSGGNAISIASPAGSGMSVPLRLGIFEPTGVRCSFTVSGGTGRLRVHAVAKG